MHHAKKIAGGDSEVSQKLSRHSPTSSKAPPPLRRSRLSPYLARLKTNLRADSQKPIPKEICATEYVFIGRDSECVVDCSTTCIRPASQIGMYLKMARQTDPSISCRANIPSSVFPFLLGRLALFTLHGTFGLHFGNDPSMAFPNTIKIF